MTSAGDLDRSIVIQRSTVMANSLNEPIETWADFATLRAKRSDVADGEKFAAGQVGAFAMSRFVIRHSTITKGIKPVDRVSYAGAVWNIKGIKETKDGRNRFLELTCVKDAD